MNEEKIKALKEEKLSGRDILIELMRRNEMINTYVLYVSCFDYNNNDSIRNLSLITRFYDALITHKRFLFENNETIHHGLDSRKDCEQLLIDMIDRSDYVFDYFGPGCSDNLDALDKILDEKESDLKNNYLKIIWEQKGPTVVEDVK